VNSKISAFVVGCLVVGCGGRGGAPPRVGASASASDQDGDGVPDDEDRCPKEPGRAHGCPAFIRIEGHMDYWLEQVHFAKNRGTIEEESSGILDTVASIMKAEPTFALTVEGHVDSTEAPALGAERARAVSRALVARGVDASRLTEANAGREIPIKDDATPEGRAANRRVEFHIVPP
jgi:outer membrane protein OmpA-like peptidoglycan-associated protein